MKQITRRAAIRSTGAIVAAGMLGCASNGTRPKPTTRQRTIYDVQNYGAKGDGTTLDTLAFQRAIDEASAAGGDSIVLVRGGKQYLVGGLMLRGGIEFHLADDAKILISTNPDDYQIAAVPRVAASQPVAAPRNDRTVFSAREAHGLKITGTGTIDGRWREFMDHFEQEREWWIPKTFRPPLMQLTGCKDLEIRQINIVGAPLWTVHLMGCQRVLVDGITIKNQLDVPNCDGVNPDHSQDVEIRNCNITCGDDAIAVKATRAGMQYGPTRNIHVHDCTFLTQDSGLKIGTETTQDIHDVLFEKCKILSSCRGLTIQLRDEGSVYNVIFRDIEFVSRYHSYPWWGRGEAISFTAFPRTPQTKLGKIHRVQVRNVTGRAENSIRINGSPDRPIENVLLEGVNVTFDRWTQYPGGEFDNRPPNDAIEKHPTPGIHLRHTRGILVRNTSVSWGQNRPDYFTHALHTVDTQGLLRYNFKGEAAHPNLKAIQID